MGPYALIKKMFSDPPDYRRKVLRALADAPDQWWNGSAIAQEADVPIRDVYPSLIRIEKAGYIVATTQPGADGKLQNCYQVTVEGVEALWSDLGEWPKKI